jgi:hypothetical protein
MELPFLSHKSWPMSKEPEERIVNPSHDKQLQDHLIQNLMVAIEQKHIGKLKEALVSLIHAINMEEESI